MNLRTASAWLLPLALDRVPVFVLPDSAPTAAPPKDSDSTAASGD